MHCLNLSSCNLLFYSSHFFFSFFSFFFHLLGQDFLLELCAKIPTIQGRLQRCQQIADMDAKMNGLTPSKDDDDEDSKPASNATAAGGSTNNKKKNNKKKK